VKDGQGRWAPKEEADMDRTEDKPKSAWARYLGKEQTLVRMADHTLLSDHNRMYGGDELGPSPGEIMAGALAA